MILSQNLREADKAELKALGKDDHPYVLLMQSMAFSSVCYTLFDPNDESIIAMLGVGPGIYEGSGVVWLLGSPKVDTHGFKFLRGSNEMLDHLFEETKCSFFYNYVHEDNTVHINWLTWLGFHFIRKVSTSRNTTFIEFVKINEGMHNV